MISVNKSKNLATLNFKDNEESGLPVRILELRNKIQNQEYVNNAILRIAQVMSYHLLEDPDELKLSN